MTQIHTVNIINSIDKAEFTYNIRTLTRFIYFFYKSNRTLIRKTTRIRAWRKKSRDCDDSVPKTSETRRMAMELGEPER